MHRLILRHFRCSVVGDRIHQVVITTHRDQIACRQGEERQVDRAPPTVPGPGRHVALHEHVRPVDVGIVPRLRTTVLRLSRPFQKTIDGTLWSIAVPQQKAEVLRCRLLADASERIAQGM